MIDKPDAANYAMDTRGRILIKTIMEIVDRSAIIRNGLRSLEWPYVIALPGKNRKSYYRYNLENPYLLELVDMVENYIEWNPKLEWLSPKEREYINDYGFRYTKDEKKKDVENKWRWCWRLYVGLVYLDHWKRKDCKSAAASLLKHQMENRWRSIDGFLI